MTNFVLASKNAHKIAEMQRILEPMGIKVLSERDGSISIPEVEENGKDFSENAKIKAVSAMSATGMPSIGDDSGLCVDALDGAPGIYSARYSGDHDDKANNSKLLFELSGVPSEKRTARFKCSICCAFPNGDVITAEGTCEGSIGYELRGENGFGYDPLFMVGEKSFAELTDSQKDEISHRGVAMRKFAEKIENYLKGMDKNDK